MSNADQNQSGPGEPREAGQQIFDWVRSTGIYRPDGAWAGGVFAAAAAKLGWDAVLVRGLGVVAFLPFFSPMALFYGVAWLFLPDPRGRIHAQQALRGEYTSGFWGAAALSFIGAVNVFTPNIAGPFAVLLNLAIIGVAAWALWLLVCNYRQNQQQGGTGSNHSPSGGTSAAGSSEEDSQKDSDSSKGQRDHGVPAWYPKEGPPPRPAPEPAATAQAPSTGYAAGSDHTRPMPEGGLKTHEEPKKQKPKDDPRAREERRRRRMVSFGLLLLAVPLIAGAVWFAAANGLAVQTAVLLGLAAVVTLLSLMHLFSALRGKKGRGGLLALFTVLMMLVFASPMQNWQNSSHHVFGNYTTDSPTVNNAFANTTVDLRDLEFSESDALDFSDANVQMPHETGNYAAIAEVNNAFGKTTVIVPDGVYIDIDPNVFLANVNIRTQDWWDSDSGISSNSRGGGPEEAVGAVQLNFANAFGNITIYDATTYAEEHADEEASR